MTQAIPGPTEEPPLRVRHIDFDFDSLPRHWFYGAAFPTHVINGLHLVFPAGERFFIRSVRHYLPVVSAPLKRRIKGFFGQEARHGLAHERAFARLEAQGFDVQSFLTWYESLAFERIEPRFSPALRLAVTAAAEHFTACLAEVALTTDYLDHAHPAMRDLLRWHAAEEIEHKSVAFDVLAEVDGRYATRLAGLVVAGSLLLFFWGAATRRLLRQDRVSKDTIRAERRAMAARGQDLGVFLRAALEYAKPGFHPDQRDNQHLAREYLRSIGRLDG